MERLLLLKVLGLSWFIIIIIHGYGYLLSDENIIYGYRISSKNSA